MAILTSGSFARQQREDMGMSREELAHRAGVSVSTIVRLENYDHAPTSRNLAAIAAHLHVPVDKIIATHAISNDEPGPQVVA